jgi:hypothetical protein
LALNLQEEIMAKAERKCEVTIVLTLTETDACFLKNLTQNTFHPLGLEGEDPDDTKIRAGIFNELKEALLHAV